MGISKKLMLASLVSMMVLLAFVIGLVPSHDTARARAAGDSGRIDFGQFLDLILMNQGGMAEDKGAGTVLDSLPYEDGDTIIVPTTNQGGIDVLLSATVSGSDNNTTVTYVANPANDDEEAALPWSTNDGVYTLGADGVFADELGFPNDFAATLALDTFIPNTQGTETALLIYALIDATLQSQSESTFMYASVNAMDDAIALTIATEANDSDFNGFPDDPFTDVPLNASSVANLSVNGANRTALVKIWATRQRFRTAIISSPMAMSWLLRRLRKSCFQRASYKQANPPSLWSPSVTAWTP